MKIIGLFAPTAAFGIIILFDRHLTRITNLSSESEGIK